MDPANTNICLVYKHCTENLRSHLSQLKNGFQVNTALTILVQILDGLKSLHELVKLACQATAGSILHLI